MLKKKKGIFRMPDFQGTMDFEICFTLFTEKPVCLICKTVAPLKGQNISHCKTKQSYSLLNERTKKDKWKDLISK